MIKRLTFVLCVVVLINLGELLRHKYLFNHKIIIENNQNLSVSSDRTKDKIYENVHGHMCFRRLNATHQIGCSCKFNDN